MEELGSAPLPPALLTLAFQLLLLPAKTANKNAVA